MRLVVYDSFCLPVVVYGCVGVCVYLFISVYAVHDCVLLCMDV